ncbi:MAG TPA: DUF2844 domain-containing protein [Steroidobacteraceae bacterium]|nr:DUF2844 domain-containing protein [Steroidobacteraceae bacterium]
MKLTRIALLSLAAGALVSLPAFAGLGGDSASVQADMVQLKGTVRVSTAGTFTLHEITANSGVKVREYAGSDGRVFAVAWNGPAGPDLRQVLGSHYDQFVQALAAQPRHSHRHVLIQEDDLVVERNVFQRAASGRAWTPSMLPKDFSAEQIQ